MNTVIESELKPKIVKGVLEIPISRIEPDPNQPRKQFRPEYIESLAAAIKSEGLLQPILVRKNPEKADHYLIIAGECRWRAHAFAGIQVIRCLVSDKHDDNRRRFRVQLLENMGRENMTFREEAFGISHCIDSGDTAEAIGESLGMSAHRVETIAKLTKLSPQIWMLLDAGTIHRKVAECAVATIPADDVESVLLRGAGKTMKVAAAVIDAYVDQQKQNELTLAIDRAGIAPAKAETTTNLAKQIMQVGAMIEKLSGREQATLARKLGGETAMMVPQTKQTRRAIAFLMKAFNKIDADLSS